ncbi:NgoMIV family type II restriction endonuclease [Catellatospora tritici]|uniref:NgoMIV family type II restriction endonuclease n=1 Tax=Catellatospora tritici TaxID=2851566 RepID=UPI001C2D77B0|nr:NgoMIV family type II restriction endonuclease [Catellatospora tritici]MBV1853952.1 hypothetical protein [Catellatospora tritici]
MTATEDEAPSWLIPLLGYRKATEKQRKLCLKLFGHAHAPNIADATSAVSTRIAGIAYDMLKISKTDAADLSKADESAEDEEPGTAKPRGKSSGIALERLIRDDLATVLAAGASERGWTVECGRKASSYRQFSHLDALQELFVKQPELRAAVGQDYQVQTDVCVGLPAGGPAGGELLHAAVSSKWSLRSDRAQNVRHEFGMLVRNRRGRLPHLVLVTAEPLPTRLLSIARGTGEIDAVYHLLFHEIAQGVQTSTKKQRDAWDELVGQGRLLPYRALAHTLAHG